MGCGKTGRWYFRVSLNVYGYVCNINRTNISITDEVARHDFQVSPLSYEKSGKISRTVVNISTIVERLDFGHFFVQLTDQFHGIE